MKKTKELNTNKGITLIALVITIIVMLILVGVTISMAVNGGLFEKAGEAVSKTDEALDEEKELTEGKIQINGAWYDSIDKYLSEEKSFESYPEYSTSLLDAKTGVLTENTKYTDANKEVAVIPKGFYLTNVEDEINEGIVIEDAEENQFVWVPVEEGTFERTSWIDNMTGEDYIEQMDLDSYSEDELIEELAMIYAANDDRELEECLVAFGILESETDSYTTDDLKDFIVATRYFSGDIEEEEDIKEEIIRSYLLDTSYIENASNDPTGEYVKMVASVNKYGGFYIGRYEAGSVENRQEDGTRTPGTTTLGVRKGLYPYNMVCWGTSMTEYDVERENTSGSTTYDYGYGAVYLSKTMYTGNAYGVISTLCYGVQWDATLRFINEKVNVTNSTQWGNYQNHGFTFTGKYSTDNGVTWNDGKTSKPNGGTWLLTTGASGDNQAKNIYDLAGNVWEWTMESFLSTYRVARGSSLNASRTTR